MLAEKKLIKSPLNYTGGKYRLLEQMLSIFPKEPNIFIDLFCGGANVGINIDANKIICIDNQRPLIRLFNTFKREDKEWIFHTIDNIIDEYQLSRSSKYGFEYYGCIGTDGLGKYNKEKFIKLRHDYNNRNGDNSYYDIMFYTIIIYSFNHNIRFNRKEEYNIPVGKRDFNPTLQRKLSEFIDRIKSKDIIFISKDFRNLDYIQYNHKDIFIYADPPYLLTKATYNEHDGWNEKKERQLLMFMDSLNCRGIKFALSNVLESKGRKNWILADWSQKYNIYYLDSTYTNSSYQKKENNKKAKTMEVIITNY